MGIQNLDKIFNPESVAVYGASERRGTIGFVIMANLINGKLVEDVYPVNRKKRVIWGLPACRSMLDVDFGDVIDLFGGKGNLCRTFDRCISIAREMKV